MNGHKDETRFRYTFALTLTYSFDIFQLANVSFNLITSYIQTVLFNMSNILQMENIIWFKTVYTKI